MEKINENITRAKSIFEIMAQMDILEALPRTGYLLCGVNPCENIASHCFGAAFLAMLLADAEENIDKEKVIRMALVHEASETRTGDIPLPAKKYFKAGALKEAETSASKEVFSFLNQERYSYLVKEYCQGKTREAKLVRAADKLQMLCKARFYEQQGHKNLEDFFQNDQEMDLDNFPVANALFEYLKNLNK